MASINLRSENGGGDGYRSPERSVRVSPARITVVRDENDELSPPVVSVSFPVETASFSSSPIQEQIVKSSTDTASGSDESSDGGGNAVKKPVWSKPANVVEVVSPVMDVASWPVLGESTKTASSSSSSDSLQVTANSSSSSHKPSSVNPASTPNHVTHSAQRSMRRGSGISGADLSSTGRVSQRSPASQESKVESVTNPPVKPAMVLDPYPKDHTYKEPPRGGLVSQPNSGNDHHYQQNAYKRGYGGPHPRGHSQSQGRGYQERNQHRNFNNKDTTMQPHRGGYHRGGYIRPSAHNSTPFIHPPMPQPVRPFGSNIMYPDAASGIIYFHGPPHTSFFPAPIYFPVLDPLPDKIRKQIEFYFSIDNLVKDIYLRRCMDEEGWVPVNFIAGFNKVLCLTDNVQLILDVMQQSTVVEVQGNKMRRRDDWVRWLMPPGVQDSLGRHSQPGGGDPPPVA
ncbi:putative la-type HTH domain, winged helix-like DNA-binding domain superfamily [Helianthus annuus]|uniref:La-type HTH domain, winged helix-like DNA-binding domain superfamily n=1 Tax=Helianthus annuus TaxID=4232 RepID=A0A251TU15_HELAN|nr:la-related protein 1C isoform X2 [Helianthus annuus]KAF5765181.1 putative la-type HTH domain, winged helix-like DNA-binding domain superfamily [Helianthus annuus]KAJ0451744.1 putative la-type HTH domain, winged helix-like DNA-binding domain superfamily [Helianthus annuus]KAJ0473630.1 putative la-type HTH domain, winged helix-like DNA-binding domain superfamily [Helianthus annuus]KAJ0649207.1 putative la-type HTH domain, winged helix-like DNA-binding domain superfamily [Helianthus annuus]KAJ